jgi:hypothetical protein
MQAIDALQLLGLPSTPEDWAEAIGAAKLAEKWAESTKNEAKKWIAEGGTAPGWKLRASGNVSTIRDVATVWQRLNDRGLGHVFIAAASARLSTIRDALGTETVDALLSD